jgi:PAS domain S-box-containing protein
VRDAGGEVVSLLGSVADITERDAAVHTLMTERNRSVQTLNSLSDGIAAFDRNYRVVVWNPVMASLTGLGESDVLGKGDVLQMLGLRDTPFAKSFGAVLDGEAVSLEEVRIAVPSTGKQAVAACRLLPLHDGEGEPAGIVAIFTGPGASPRGDEANRSSGCDRHDGNP